MSRPLATPPFSAPVPSSTKNGTALVGVGAVIGVNSLLAATQGGAPLETDFVTLVERIFGLWAYVAAWMLWRGRISSAGPAASGAQPA